MDPKILDDIAKKLANSLPAGLGELQADVEKNLRAGLESTLAKLNLISREEFEVQSAVLARTRAKIENLEKLVSELEKKILEKG
jgi:BMFP domain-containing protein YqiC